MLRRVFVALVSGVVGTMTSAAQQPVAIPGATQHDLTSRINGRTYRILVSTPPKFDSTVAYPVLYVLDANINFGTVREAVQFQSFTKLAAPAIVVGIAYPTNDLDEWVRLRQADLTPTQVPNPDPARNTGGADAFLRVIEEEVKPFVTMRHRVDRSKQIIFGASLGGLLALRGLFRNPAAFSDYILASPSIWWDGRAILRDEAAFAERGRAGELRLTVIVTSARDEQYHGSDPKLLAEAQRGSRMVDNASELAGRLAALSPDKIKVHRIVFEDESHNSMLQAAVSRGVRLALSPR